MKAQISSLRDLFKSDKQKLEDESLKIKKLADLLNKDAGKPIVDPSVSALRFVDSTVALFNKNYPNNQVCFSAYTSRGMLIPLEMLNGNESSVAMFGFITKEDSRLSTIDRDFKPVEHVLSSMLFMRLNKEIGEGFYSQLMLWFLN